MPKMLWVINVDNPEDTRAEIIKIIKDRADRVNSHHNMTKGVKANALVHARVMELRSLASFIEDLVIQPKTPAPMPSDWGHVDI